MNACWRPSFKIFLFAYSIWLGHTQANAFCFEEAGQRYGVSPLLLKAIAQQESSLNPLAYNSNRNGSTDMGLMQINSRWLPLLNRHGVQTRDIWSPCTNVMVGAWILASNFARMGYNIHALGAYNSTQPEIQIKYAKQVLRRLENKNL